MKSQGSLGGVAVMIYGGIIHNRCHRLCVFFCQAADGREKKKKRGGGRRGAGGERRQGGGVVN